MSRSCLSVILAILLVSLFSACSTPPLRIQSGDVPAGALRIGQIVAIGKREQIVSADNGILYKSILAAGIPDSEISDGSVVVARIYCCGGVSAEISAEHAERRMLYVPKDTHVGLGDFVEFKAGRPPEGGDSGLLNTVTRVVAKRGDNPEKCWWDPRNPKLWLRTPFCEWMQEEGWVKQGGISPAWYKPAK